MAEDWNAIAAEVAGALGDVGHTAALLRPGGRDPDSPEYDPMFLPDQEISVKLLGDTMVLGLINGSTILAGDRREMMAAEGTTPTPADRLRIDGTEYAIVRAEPYAPSGVVLYFDLILRA
ncbi:hypothetical protein [Paracoccus benzoatiresistens]|uniref:Uncharacterized protein n=1 Tax=Paracoccus benzoatiresistens TaxID=2997341 RepID=A0ABT4JB45_9RHOB|nr:hypothetical protein [Paracoccus sp. EF6]MCZ0964307.1 hypothetical protein [Paracoccus sp. EF6]